MVKSYIIEFFWSAFIAVLIIFMVLKLAIMASMKVKGNFLEIFGSSLLIYDKQSVKNTFDEGLQKYLKVSNKVNVFFYFLLAAIVILYLLMLAI